MPKDAHGSRVASYSSLSMILQWGACRAQRALIGNKFLSPTGLGRKTSQYGRTQKFSGASSNMSTESTSPTALAPFGSLTSELEKIAPPLEIQANQIQILKEPKDFYESLKVCSNLV